jgi:C4-dicarboxylate-specific signal transduction histidine kinase
MNIDPTADPSQRKNVELQRAHELTQEPNACSERHAEELRRKDAQLAGEIAVRERVEAELTRTRSQLHEASRLAASAELTNNVLHNVGNVLVSVNVSASLIADRVKDSNISQLARVVAMFGEHASDLGNFIMYDPRGKRTPEFLARLSHVLHREHEDMLQEVAALRTNLDRICEIVAAQQSNTKLAGNRALLDPRDLVEDALRLSFDQSGTHGIDVVRDFAEVPSLVIEKHKVIEILENLLLNAKAACAESRRPDPRLTIRVAACDSQISIGVSDNGIGILPENLPRIFTHGFTTKKNGHGFGLHSAVLAAKAMGGALKVHSDGPGCGATFTLELPISSAETGETAHPVAAAPTTPLQFASNPEPQSQSRPSAAA